MSDFQEHLKEQLKDPAFRTEYERLQPEFEVARAIIAARVEKNLTQQELADKIGMRQSNISRIESGSCSPTVATLQQIAAGMGKKLHIEFK